MTRFQIPRNDIQILRNEIQAGWNKFQIRRNEIKIHYLYFSKAYTKTADQNRCAQWRLSFDPPGEGHSTRRSPPPPPVLSTASATAAGTIARSSASPQQKDRVNWFSERPARAGARWAGAQSARTCSGSSCGRQLPRRLIVGGRVGDRVGHALFHFLLEPRDVRHALVVHGLPAIIERHRPNRGTPAPR